MSHRFQAVITAPVGACVFLKVHEDDHEDTYGIVVRQFPADDGAHAGSTVLLTVKGERLDVDGGTVAYVGLRESFALRAGAERSDVDLACFLPRLDPLTRMQRGDLICDGIVHAMDQLLFGLESAMWEAPTVEAPAFSRHE